MREERGSLSVETVILTPIFVLFVLFVSYAGRITAVQQDLHIAADVAARTASQSRTGSMSTRGFQSAQQSMNDNQAPCTEFSVRVARRTTSGSSEVEVFTQCRVDVWGLSLLGIRSPLLSGYSREVIDVYRHP
jgi:Flp pilus assembly protein TadG